MGCYPIVYFHSAPGGTRTRTALPPKDFKSFVSTIPPPGLIFKGSGSSSGRRRPDLNRRVSVLQTAALNHFATTPCDYLWHFFYIISNISCLCFSPLSISKCKKGSIPILDFCFISSLISLAFLDKKSITAFS